MVAIRIEQSFIERLRLLSPGRQAYIIGRIHWFQHWPDDQMLRKRPFKALPDHYLIDSAFYDRIVLRLEPDGVYAAVDCGGHDVIDLYGSHGP